MQNGLTVRQDRLADYLLDPRIKTQREAGRLAGYSDTASLDSIVSEALNSPKFLKALDKRRRDGLDSGPGYAAFSRQLRRLLGRAVAAVEKSLDNLEKKGGEVDLATAGALSKLFSDLSVNAAKLKSLEGDPVDDDKERHAARRQWTDAVLYAYTLGVAMTRRFGPARAAELAAEVPSQIERRILRRGGNT